MADAKESKTFTITDESGESSVYEIDSFTEEQVNLWGRIQQLTQERDQITLRGQEINMLINQYGFRPGSPNINTKKVAHCVSITLTMLLIS